MKIEILTQPTQPNTDTDHIGIIEEKDIFERLPQKCPSGVKVIIAIQHCNKSKIDEYFDTNPDEETFEVIIEGALLFNQNVKNPPFEEGRKYFLKKAAEYLQLRKNEMDAVANKLINTTTENKTPHHLPIKRDGNTMLI